MTWKVLNLGRRRQTPSMLASVRTTFIRAYFWRFCSRNCAEERVANMAVNDAIIWIYLARRDKTGIRILSQFRGKKIMPTRVLNLPDLKLPTDYQEVLSKTIYDNRMMYEPWIESAADYASLRAKLKARGYTNIPLTNLQEYGNASPTNAPDISTKNIPQIRTMVRKLS